MLGMTSEAVVRPFTSAIPEAELVDLRERLARTRWPTALVHDWSDGTDLAYLQELCAYWEKSSTGGRRRRG